MPRAKHRVSARHDRQADTERRQRGGQWRVSSGDRMLSPDAPSQLPGKMGENSKHVIRTEIHLVVKAGEQASQGLGSFFARKAFEESLLQ